MDIDTREVVNPPGEGVCPIHSGWRGFDCTGYLTYVCEIVHLLTCDSRGCCQTRTLAFVEACRAEAETIHVPMVRRLVAKKMEKNPFVEELRKTWKKLTDALKISEVAIRKEWLARGECWNPWCTNRRGDKTIKTKRCARCQVIRYCSVECQKA